MSKKSNYQQVSFWETRYKQNICEWYQWLASPNQVSSLIQKYLPEPKKILELGCGSSNLAQKLMALHHQSVTCLDFSKQIIKHKNKNAKDGVNYKVHDLMQKLPFEDQSFDAIIEKNTLDCLFCYEDYPARVMKVMKDCYRVLKQGGVMLSISHGREKARRFFYRNRFSPFNLEIVPVGDLKPGQTQVWMYVLTKGQADEPKLTGAIEQQAQEEDPNQEAEAERAQEQEQKQQVNEDFQNEKSLKQEQQPQQEEQKPKDQGNQVEPEQKSQKAQQQQQYEFDQLDQEQVS